MQHVVPKSLWNLLIWLFLNGKVWTFASETSDSDDSKGSIVCLFRNSTGPETQFHVEGLTFVSGCQFCFAKGRIPQSHGFQILEQGCFRNISLHGCNSTQCIVPQGGHSNDFFCCCSQHNCNQILVQVAPLKEWITHQVKQLLIGFAIVALIFAIALVFFLKLRSSRKYEKFDFQDIKSPFDEISEPLFVIEKAALERKPEKYLEIAEVIHNGAFSNIHKGVIRAKNMKRELNVVIKVFPPQFKEYFKQMKTIFELAHIRQHPHILKCFAGYPGLDKENLMILEYCPFGTLDSYLRVNTLTWNEMCQILDQISQGLATLHGENCPTESVAICHRDLNSRNILVSYGLQCRITGLELAIIFDHGKQKPSPTNGENKHGVTRYLAPELLDGALNLRNYQTSLKQVDVYALGLLFWEVANRCREIYKEIEVPSFQLAFEVELGSKKPSVKQMQNLVLQNKTRPHFSPAWASMNAGIQLLKETMSYCWDGDAEARLTTLGVVERIREMDSLWAQHGQISSDQSWIKSPNQKQFGSERSDLVEHAILLDRFL